MQLIVEELELDLYTVQQLVTVGDTPRFVRSIRPHIYKHNNPAGSLKVQILTSGLVLVKESDAVTIQSITDVSNSFFHGYVKFDLNCGMQANTNYYIKLTSTGYTFSESAYIGWCKDFDLRHYTADYSPSTGESSALDMEIWGLKNVVKGMF